MRFAVLALAWVACTGDEPPLATDDPTDAPWSDVTPGSELVGSAQRIDDTLAPTQEQYDIPGLGGAIIDSDGIFAVGVSGTRHADSTDPIIVEHRWHLGSLTKAMTGTLAAILVNDEVLTYDTTVDEVWPEVHESWRGVTLEMLLTHRSGATGSLGGEHPDLWVAAFSERDGYAGRTAMVAALTSRPQDAVQGEYTYSNAGFIVAGAMMEERTNQSWEDLMETRLYRPYGMDECGFGAPQGNHPWGHSYDAGRPVDPASTTADNPPALGPAGTVHCSLASWGQFVALHIRGANGTESSLPASAFERMHTPIGDYGHGWFPSERSWAEGLTLSHRGSNTMWVADMWVAPNTDRAYIAVSNTAFGDSGTGVDQAIGALIQAGLERE